MSIQIFVLLFLNARKYQNSVKPSFNKFLGAILELNDFKVNFVPFLPIFGISLRLKRELEVQKFLYIYFTVVLDEAIN